VAETTDRGAVYLDYQSAKPVDPRVVEMMTPYFTERFGNPASLHGVGDDATATLETARARVATSIGALPEEIVFTSGATESNNLALLGYANRNRRAGDHVVISEVDHISIHNLGKALEREGFRIAKVPPDQFGRIDPEKVRKRVTAETILVSIGWASNEIGTVQPMAEIAEVVAGTGAALHSDAVAVQGQLPIDVSRVGVGMLTLSGNDIYGPQGVGALYIRKGVKIAPVAFGGGQENGLRSGTENLAGIVGMGAAAEIMSRELTDDAVRMAALRDLLVRGVLAGIPDSHLNGHPTERLPGNAHFRFEGVEGESLVLLMREEGISVATGSACSSKTLEPSHTLISCGLLHEEAHGSLEFTFGRWSTESDVGRVLAVLPGVVDKLRRMSPLYHKR
jgi:cysteine desulfurase